MTVAADIVLVHTSDLHVDNTDEAALDRHHGLAGLQAVLQTAAAVRADVVLLAGDTFENNRVKAPALRRTAEMLAAAPAPVVLLPGNHDSIRPDCLYRRGGLTEIANVHLLGITHEDAIVFPEHELEIWGRAHRGDDDMWPLETVRPRTTRWQIAMAHGHYVAPADWKDEAHRAWRISDDALAATGADYVALGHWDRPVQVGDGTVRAYYSGAPHLAGTVNVVRLSRQGSVEISREALR